MLKISKIFEININNYTHHGRTYVFHQSEFIIHGFLHVEIISLLNNQVAEGKKSEIKQAFFTTQLAL